MFWLDTLCMHRDGDTPLSFNEQPLVGSGRVLALAPHPDDPDAVAVTLRLLARGGWDLFWTNLTPAWSGVQDDFVGPSPQVKAQAREAEERDAARLFGLPDDRLTFLRLAETVDGSMAETVENRERLTAFLDALAPDLVLLPSREDTNATHRLTYRWFAEWASCAGRLIVALGNEDPKTVAFCPDMQIVFGEKTAAWKATLLECHQSQSARNRATRGITFTERILAVNRACPNLPPGSYAERFQVECWGR